MACHVQSTSWIGECRQARLPLVLVHDNIRRAQLEDIGQTAVLVEDLKGLQELVTHLVQRHGCRHLHVAIGDYTRHHNRARKMREIIEAAKPLVTIHATRDVHIVREYTYAEGCRLAEELLATGGAVDAVICLADSLAQGVWDVMRAAGQPVRVTGYDNSTVARDFDLTSVVQNLPDLGEEAVIDLDYLARYPGANPLLARLTHTALVARSSCCWPQ